MSTSVWAPLHFDGEPCGAIASLDAFSVTIMQRDGAWLMDVPQLGLMRLELHATRPGAAPPLVSVDDAKLAAVALLRVLLDDLRDGIDELAAGTP